MKEMTEELFSKWVDDCLTSDEKAIVDAAVQDDPSLLSEMESMRGLGMSLKETFPASQEPPYPDFFNTQVMNKVAQVQREQAAPVVAPKVAWWHKIGLNWVPASALAAVLAFFAGTKMNSPVEDVSGFVEVELPYVYTPEARHEARVIANERGEVAAIVMDGLDAIRDDMDFATADATTALPEGYLVSVNRHSF